jgi:hypothetical protein
LSSNNIVSQAAAFALLASCSATPQQPNRDEPILSKPDAGVSQNEATPLVAAPVLATYEPGRVTMTARTTGTLQRRGSCLVVVHGNATEGDLIVFPQGSARWDSESESLIYKNTSTKIGAKIDLGGGAINIDEAGVKISNLSTDCKSKIVWLAG